MRLPELVGVQTDERPGRSRDARSSKQFYLVRLSRAREAGAVTADIYCLQRLCFGHDPAGDLVALRISAEEFHGLATGADQPGMTALPAAWLAVLAALQGRDGDESLRLRLEQLVATHPLGIMTDPVHDLICWAAGIRAAGAGGCFAKAGLTSRAELAQIDLG